jgi:DNA polymerase III delta prime subunit
LNSEQAERIKGAAQDSASAYHRLVLVVGPARSGKTAALQCVAREAGWPIVNLNLCLSESLLELTHRQRALRADRIVGEIVQEAEADTVILDNIEILFTVGLKLDPLRLLQGLSRNRTIIAAWPGSIEGDTLLYGESGHPEYRRETRIEAIIVSCGNADQLSESQSALAESQA